MKAERIRNESETPNESGTPASTPPPTVEIRNDTPTVENDPTEGIRGYSGN